MGASGQKRKRRVPCLFLPSAWENRSSGAKCARTFSAECEANGYERERGDIFYADLSPVVGSEQGGCRPVLIVQNDTGNKHSPTVIAAAITSQTGKARLPTHIALTGHDVGLSKDSVILLEQIRTIDKRRLREHTGHADRSVMDQVDSALAVSFGLQGS